MACAGCQKGFKWAKAAPAGCNERYDPTLHAPTPAVRVPRHAGLCCAVLCSSVLLHPYAWQRALTRQGPLFKRWQGGRESVLAPAPRLRATRQRQANRPAHAWPARCVRCGADPAVTRPAKAHSLALPAWPAVNRKPPYPWHTRPLPPPRAQRAVLCSAARCRPTGPKRSAGGPPRCAGRRWCTRRAERSQPWPLRSGQAPSPSTHAQRTACGAVRCCLRAT